MTNQRARAVVMGAILLMAPAFLQATPVTVTYNFDETGWSNMAGTSENFAGSFTGAPQAGGVTALADITSFFATITETNSTNQTKTIGIFGGALGLTGLSDFLFDPATNSLSLAVSGSPGALICLGADVAAGACGALPGRQQPKPGTPPLPPIEGYFVSSVNGSLNAFSTALPSIIQPVSPMPVAAPVAAPEPSSFALCGGGLLLASIFLRIGASRMGKRSIANSR